MLEPLPALEPRLHISARFARNLPQRAALGWLTAGWSDLCRDPAQSLLYGLAVFVLSALVVLGMIWSGLPSLIFPALSGFLVIGPLLAIGLYEKSRRLKTPSHASLRQMRCV